MIHEAVCFLAGWNAGCLVCYFFARKLVKLPVRTGTGVHTIVVGPRTRFFWETPAAPDET